MSAPNFLILISRFPVPAASRHRPEPRFAFLTIRCAENTISFRQSTAKANHLDIKKEREYPLAELLRPGSKIRMNNPSLAPLLPKVAEACAI